jgi:hypothetical protein
MVLTLAGLDRRSVTPDEIMLWLGAAPGKTKACIELAISKGWVQRKEVRPKIALSCPLSSNGTAVFSSVILPLMKNQDLCLG